MKKIMCKVVGTAMLFGALCVSGTTSEARAGVSVNINLGLPAVVFAEPPELVPVPGMSVYFAPHPDMDVFFYGGYWWSPRGSRWYRARDYNGPWGAVNRRHVPAQVFRVPHDYRERYGHERHIPYGQWKKEYSEGHGDRKGHRGGRGHDRGHRQD